MVDDISHDDAPSEVEESTVAEAGRAAEDITANFEVEFAPGFEPEPLPLWMRPFDLVNYHPRTHMMAPGGMTRFDDFIGGIPEDVLLREPDSHLSHSVTEEDFRSCRNYRAVTARDWYYELPPEVRDLVDEVGFGLFCTELSRHMARRALLGALVER
ncbi:hypothetical protein ACSBR1_002024 [Camellia fascicularis]